jgi:hypothetical protein
LAVGSARAFFHPREDAERAGKGRGKGGRRTALATVERRFEMWSSQFRWRDRTDAYDSEFDRRVTEGQMNRMALQNRRYEGLAATVSARIGERLRLRPGEEKDGRKSLDVNEMDFEGAVRALGKLQEIEGKATFHPAHTLRGMFSVPGADMAEIAEGFFQIALEHMDELRRPLYAQAIKSFVESGGKRNPPA